MKPSEWILEAARAALPPEPACPCLECRKRVPGEGRAPATIRAELNALYAYLDALAAAGIRDVADVRTSGQGYGP